MQRDQAALYTDMGTGKTKIMIDLIVNRGWQYVLIVCTNRGCDVWEQQIAIHSNIAPESVYNLSGVSTHEKIRLLQENGVWGPLKAGNGPFILIVNYEAVWRDEFARYLMRKTVRLDCVICDESHRIKSPGSKCSQFLARLGRKVPCRYLVTGTPLAENPLDVYAQYRFLDPSIFGTSYAQFRDRYQNLDIRRSMAVGFPILDKKRPYKNLEELQEKVFSVAFKVPSSVSLPEQTDIIRTFRIGEKASRVYKKLSKEGIIHYGKWFCDADNALTLLIRKQQLASGFVRAVTLDKERKAFRLDNTRREVLESVLGELSQKEPVVVFCQFVHDLREVRRACAAVGRGYSELSGAEDTEQAWQAGGTSVLGVQISKGAESADFTRARYIVYYTLTNRLALYLQSKKRIHRPGQTRPVYYIHLIAELSDGRQTIDGLVLEAVQQKKDIVEYVMENESNILK